MSILEYIFHHFKVWVASNSLASLKDVLVLPFHMLWKPSFLTVIFIGGVFVSGCASTSTDALQRHQKDAEIKTVVSDPDTEAEAIRILLEDCVIAGQCANAKTPEHAAARAFAVLSMAPDHPVANISLAIALAMQGRDAPLYELYQSGDAKLMRDLATSVLEIEPENPWAHGFLSVWHVEAIRRGGVLSSSVLGADLDIAAEHFEQVKTKAPNILVLHWQYARALIANNGNDPSGEARLILNDIVNAKVSSDRQSAIQHRSEQLLDLLLAEEFDNAQKFANTVL